MSRWCRPALVAILVLGGSLGFTPSAPVGLALEWRVPDRLWDANDDGRVDPASVENAAARSTAIRLRVDGAGDCAGGLAWKLDDDAEEPTRLGGCDFELKLPDAEPHELEVEAADEKVTEVVQARDVLVVSVGDSVASGEGNPDRFGGRWLESRCHRSMQSGAAQAAVALERGDRHSAVTFVPLGCSGATIAEGLLGEYAGVDPDRRGNLRAQLDELDTLDGRRSVDAVLVSVGANDVHFAPLVQFCISQPDCSTRRFNPDAPVFQARQGTPTAREVVGEAIAGLRPAFAMVARRLRRVVAPEHVAILEYFDPLTHSDGHSCPRALFGIGPAEVTWAREEVLARLNAAVRSAAEDHGWAVARGIAAAFATHGVCVRGRGRWVLLPEESLFRQWWVTGTLHPNEAGHQASAALIVPVLAAVIGSYGGELTELTGIDDDGGGVPAVLLLVALAVGFGLGALLHRAVSR